jgi:hypothetical protein
MKRHARQRTTSAAATVRCRVVPSQSIGYDGWFLQGGHYTKKNGCNYFVCAIDGFSDDLHGAKVRVGAATMANEVIGSG